MMMNPRTNPMSGETNMGTITFQSTPAPLYQWVALGCDQMMARQLLCEAASAAPHSAPINAWLELDGNPSHQVRRFQKMAPSSVQMSMSEDITITLESTM